MLAAALTALGIISNFPALMAMGAIIWFMQLAASPDVARRRRTTRNKTKDRAVEGKHAKSE
jgi:hypothetical protein